MDWSDLRRCKGQRITDVKRVRHNGRWHVELYVKDRPTIALPLPGEALVCKLWTTCDVLRLRDLDPTNKGLQSHVARELGERFQSRRILFGWGYHNRKHLTVQTLWSFDCSLDLQSYSPKELRIMHWNERHPDAVELEQLVRSRSGSMLARTRELLSTLTRR
jgi:hypothetical protein